MVSVCRLALVLAGLILLGLGVAAGPAAAATSAALMRTRPFAPNDKSLFCPDVYPSAPTCEPATGTTLTEGLGRDALRAYLQDEFPADPAARNAAVAVYDDAAAEAKIPDPELRAAFAALKGTFAEGATDVFLRATAGGSTPLFASARFGGLPITVLARSALIAGTDPDQFEVIFNVRYRYESPFLFTNVWAHEVLHQDRPSRALEEGVAWSLNGLVYLHQIGRHPELARSPTQLARLLNGWVLPRLNSGRGSALGLYESNGGHPVLPGSSTYPQTDWWSWFGANQFGIGSDPTPGNPLLGRYLARTHTPGAPNCSGAEFNQALLDCVDANRNSGLCVSELIPAAQALKLKIGGTPSDAGPCGKPSGGEACTKARAAWKKAKSKLRMTKSALTRAEQSGKQGKIRNARSAVRRARDQVNNARKKVKGTCS